MLSNIGTIFNLGLFNFLALDISTNSNNGNFEQKELLQQNDPHAKHIIVKLVFPKP
jgi:hypothetical protein